MTQVSYLGAPYTHEDRFVRQARVLATGRIVCYRMQKGIHLYSPIMQGHYSEMAWGHEMPYALWIEHGLAMLDALKHMTVLQLPGWEKSAGLQVEIAHCEEKKYPIEHIEWGKLKEILSKATVYTLEVNA